MHPEISEEAEQPFLKSKRTLAGKLSKLLRKVEKQVCQRENTLSGCRSWQSVHHEGELIQANLYRMQKGMEKVVVADWLEQGREFTILLDPNLEPYEQAVKLFQRSRKLRLGVPHAERLLKLSYENANLISQQLLALECISSSAELKLFCATIGLSTAREKPSTSVKKTEPAKPYRAFEAQSGIQIWVGKSARKNDMLTFHYAKGSDWWLHARDYPGSHVILRVAKNQDPDKDAIDDAAELALRFSKANDHREGEVTISRVKFLARTRNSPGKVQVSKHKAVHIRLENARWERLRKSELSV